MGFLLASDEQSGALRTRTVTGSPTRALRIPLGSFFVSVSLAVLEPQRQTERVGFEPTSSLTGTGVSSALH